MELLILQALMVTESAQHSRESGLRNIEKFRNENVPMTINQGDLYWIHPSETEHPHLGSYSHPYVVVQDDLFNHSRIHTVVVCALSTNLQDPNAYGNVLLDPGEASLPKQSIVVVSKIVSVEKALLGDYIGRLSAQRVEQILAGIRFLQSSFQR